MIKAMKYDPKRRYFLKSTAAVGAGLAVGIYYPDVLAGETNSQVFEPNAFVRVSPDNLITVVIKHLEMGQGAYTGLATLVADEMDADWDQIVCQGAPADASRYNNLLFGPFQGVGGSTGLANSFEQMRNAGAAAKSMLKSAAAEAWQVPVEEISVEAGLLNHSGSGKTASFGEMAGAAAKQPVPENVNLKSAEEFVFIGKTIPRKDVGKTDGTAVFTQDINLPDMLTALVAHAPRFGAKVKSFSEESAKAVAGVEYVLQTPTGVAVLAKDYWTAQKGRDALQVEWDESAAETASSTDLMQQYRELAEQPGTSARSDGDVETSMAQAAKVLEANYEFPYLAHATMEPMNCVVQINNDGVEIWNGAQLQTGDQYAVSAVVGIKPEQVKINTLYAGSSFGRRANPHSDYVVEAVQIAKALGTGQPIKLVWSREDDMKAGYFRPMYFHAIKAGLNDKGKVIAWQHRVVGQSILKGTGFEEMMVKNGIDATSVEGAANLPYAIQNLAVDLHTTENQVPVLWWRAVGSTHTGFSTETFIDELAVAADRDPVEFRMELLEGHPRHQGVLKLAAEKASWGSDLPEGKGRGVAVHESFGSYVAQVAEVTVTEGGNYTVDKVVCAVDCGVPVNPDIIKAQMEGGIGFGLSPTMVSEITLENGAVQQSNFHDYQVLRLNQMPEIEVHIVPSTEVPTGVGEPGVPVIAPAVANAIFNATGERLYKLPLQLGA